METANSPSRTSQNVTAESNDEQTDNDLITYEVITDQEKTGSGFSSNVSDHRIIGPKDSTKNRLKRIKAINGILKETIVVRKQPNQW